MELRGAMCVNDAGHLEIGGCDCVDLSRRYGTPVYVFDEWLMRRACREYRDAVREFWPDARVVYAGKAFMTMAMCRLVDEEGLGLDASSGGELFTAIKAQFPPDRIVFHGNNKLPSELEFALSAGVGRFVVDNLYELELLAKLAAEKRKRADILLRVTPGVDAHTHSYIRTGQLDSKFGFGLADGVALQAVKLASGLPGVNLTGLHFHVGSQLHDVAPYEAAIELVTEFAGEIRRSLKVPVNELNVGGGLGIRYNKNDRPIPITGFVKAVSESVKKSFSRRGLPLPRLMLEPGRSIVGEAGTTLYTVGSIKEIPGVRKYAAVDGGMTDNPRVALYQAVYEAVVANKALHEPSGLVTIAGRCCESGDMLIWDAFLPSLEPGDILAVFSTGAYNYSMASNYNRLSRPAVVSVANGREALWVRRETYEDLVRNDLDPSAGRGGAEENGQCQRAVSRAL